MLEVRTAGPSPRTVAADCAPCWMIAPHIPMRFEVKIMPDQYEMARTGQEDQEAFCISMCFKLLKRHMCGCLASVAAIAGR